MLNRILRHKDASKPNKFTTPQYGSQKKCFAVENYIMKRITVDYGAVLTQRTEKP